MNVPKYYFREEETVLEALAASIQGKRSFKCQHGQEMREKENFNWIKMFCFIFFPGFLLIEEQESIT